VQSPKKGGGKRKRRSASSLGGRKRLGSNSFCSPVKSEVIERGGCRKRERELGRVGPSSITKEGEPSKTQQRKGERAFVLIDEKVKVERKKSSGNKKKQARTGKRAQKNGKKKKFRFAVGGEDGYRFRFLGRWVKKKRKRKAF